MEQNVLKPGKALNKAYLKIKVSPVYMELFKNNLILLIDNINELESEESHKYRVSKFRGH